MAKNLNSQDTFQSRDPQAELLEVYTRHNAALVTLIAHVAADTGLTLSETVACEHLRLDGPLTPREVGNRVRLSSGAVTPLIDRLAANGFVERSPHPTDRRSVLVRYLPQEKRVVGRMYAVLEHLNAAVATLDESEKETITRFLMSMTEGLAEAVTAPPSKSS